MSKTIEQTQAIPSSAKQGAELKCLFADENAPTFTETYPTVPRARASDPSTSHSAASSVDDLRAKQKAVLSALDQSGACTMETLVFNYGHLAADGLLPPQSDSGIRTRLSELVTLGLAEPTGEYGKTASGRKAIVWRVKEAK